MVSDHREPEPAKEGVLVDVDVRPDLIAKPAHQPFQRVRVWRHNVRVAVVITTERGASAGGSACHHGHMVRHAARSGCCGRSDGREQLRLWPIRFQDLPEAMDLFDVVRSVVKTPLRSSGIKERHLGKALVRIHFSLNHQRKIARVIGVVTS